VSLQVTSFLISIVVQRLAAAFEVKFVFVYWQSVHFGNAL